MATPWNAGEWTCDPPSEHDVWRQRDQVHSPTRHDIAKTNEEYDAHINKLMRAAIEEEIEEEQQLGQSDSDTGSDSDFEYATSGDESNSGDDSDDDSEEFWYAFLCCIYGY